MTEDEIREAVLDAMRSEYPDGHMIVGIATKTGVCSDGCCDIYTCPACGRSWTDVKVS